MTVMTPRKESCPEGSFSFESVFWGGGYQWCSHHHALEAAPRTPHHPSDFLCLFLVPYLRLT